MKILEYMQGQLAIWTNVGEGCLYDQTMNKAMQILIRSGGLYRNLWKIYMDLIVIFTKSIKEMSWNIGWASAGRPISMLKEQCWFETYSKYRHHWGHSHRKNRTGVGEYLRMWDIMSITWNLSSLAVLLKVRLDIVVLVRSDHYIATAY